MATARKLKHRYLSSTRPRAALRRRAQARERPGAQLRDAPMERCESDSELRQSFEPLRTFFALAALLLGVFVNLRF